MRKRTKAALIAAAAVCALAAGLLLYAAAAVSGVSDSEIEDRLGRILNAEVKIEGVEFHVFTGTRIAGLRIRPRAETGTEPGGSSLSLSEVYLDHALVPLFFGRYRLKKIRVGRLDAKVTQGVFKWLAEVFRPEKRMRSIPQTEIRQGSVSARLPFLSRQAVIKEFSFYAGPGPLNRGVIGHSSFDFEGSTVRLRFDSSAEHSRIDAWFGSSGFDFTAIPVQVFSSKSRDFDPGSMKIRGDLAGRLSFQMPIGKPGNKPERPSLSGRITISSLSASHPAFSSGMENGYAEFSVTENTVALVDGTVNAGGGCIEFPTAGARFRGGALERVWLRAAGDDLKLPFTGKSLLLGRLPGEMKLKKVSGDAGGSLHLQWTRQNGLVYGADIELKEVSGYVPFLGADFSSLDAGLSFSSSGRVVVSRSRARMLGGHVEASGSFRVSAGGIKNKDLEIRLKNIRNEQALVGRLPGYVQDFIKKAGFRGPLINGSIAFKPGGTRVDLSVQASAAEISDLNLRLDEPALRVRWTEGSERIVFEDASAEFEGSPLRASGELSLEKPPRVNFSLLGQWMPFNSRVLSWLGVGMEGWDVRGRCDLELQARQWRPSGTKPSEVLENMQAQVQLRDASFAHPAAGKIAEHIYGHISLNSEGAYFSSMIGSFCGIGVRGGGRLPFKENSEKAYIHAESENFSLDRELFRRIPFDLGLEESDLGGHCSLKAELRGTGEEGGVAGSVTSIMHHVELSAGSRKVAANGSARLSFSADGWQEIQKPEIQGEVSLDRLSCGELAAEGVSSAFKWHEGRLSIEEINMGAYGGRIKVNEAGFEADGKVWRGSAELEHLDLETLLADFGVEGRFAPSGVVRGSLNLDGRGLDAGELSGSGSIKISRGRLYSFPILVTVFKVLDLKLPRQSPVTDAYGEFRIKKGEMKFQDLLLSGGTEPVHIQGDVSLKAGGGIMQMPIEFLVTVAKREGVLDQIPIINWAKRYTIDYLRRIVLQARVKGRLGDYEIKTISSPVVDPIRSMFSLMDKLSPFSR